MDNIVKENECEHWDIPSTCKVCSPLPLKEKMCSHKGLCLDPFPCGKLGYCCLLMKRVFHAVNECEDMDGGCDFKKMVLCSYHVGKIYYMFKKHEWDSY